MSHTIDAAANEPLLRSSHHHSSQSRISFLNHLGINSFNTTWHTIQLDKRTLLSISALYFALNFGWYFLEVPILRLFEHAVCQQYYRSHPEDIHVVQDFIEESFCKIRPIQSKVSLIAGGRVSLEAFSGLLTALFYSSIADKYGRRLVLILGYTGQLLALGWIVAVCGFNHTFPIRAVWISALFVTIGGGQPVISSILFTMLADVINSPLRARLMYILHAISLLSGVFAPQLAAWSMRQSLWFPFGVAFFLYTLQLLLVLISPETRKLGLAHSALLPRTSSPTREVMPQSVRPTSVTKIYNVFSTPSTLACLLIFFLKRAGFQSEPMIYQYVSERFAWKLQETAWFRSAISTSSVIVVGLILPFGRAYLQGDKIQNQRIDRGVIQGSSMLLVVAFFGIWLAPRPTLVTSAVVLVGLGEGLEPALQSLSASLISGTQNAQLFTAIAFMETFARIVAATVMARLYSIGQNIEAKPNGLPFLVSACLFAIGLLLSYFKFLTPR